MENLTAYAQVVSFFFFSINETKQTLFHLHHNLRADSRDESLCFLTKQNKRLSQVLLPETRCTNRDTASKDGDSLLHSQFQGTERRSPFQVPAKNLQINFILFLDIQLNWVVFSNRFRCYPGPWQVLRRTRNNYICIHQQEAMPSLKEVALNILASA